MNFREILKILLATFIKNFHIVVNLFTTERLTTLRDCEYISSNPLMRNAIPFQRQDMCECRRCNSDWLYTDEDLDDSFVFS